MDNFTLADFYGMTVTRNRGKANVIVNYNDGKPVKLFGFETDSSFSDMHIQEEAWDYYQLLRDELKQPSQ